MPDDRRCPIPPLRLHTAFPPAVDVRSGTDARSHASMKFAPSEGHFVETSMRNPGGNLRSSSTLQCRRRPSPRFRRSPEELEPRRLLTTSAGGPPGVVVPADVAVATVASPPS